MGLKTLAHPNELKTGGLYCVRIKGEHSIGSGKTAIYVTTTCGVYDFFLIEERIHYRLSLMELLSYYRITEI